MGAGFLDGVNAPLVQQVMESSMGVCVYVTPVHAQAPDADAAIRLVEVVEQGSDFGIDSAPLQAFAQ